MARSPIGLAHKLARYYLYMQGFAMAAKALSQCGPVQVVMGLAWRIRKVAAPGRAMRGFLAAVAGPRTKSQGLAVTG